MDKIFSRILSQITDKKTIEDTLFYLRSFNFRFIDTECFFEIYPKSSIKESHAHYQFLVRYVKKGQYDFRVFFAIKMWGKKTPKIHIYHGGTFIRSVRKEWKTKIDVNFRKIIKRWKFPDGLTYEERRKWRAEHRKVTNPRSSYIGSEWYHKWAKSIVFTENPPP